MAKHCSLLSFMTLSISRKELDFSHICRPRQRLDQAFLLVKLERSPVVAVRQANQSKHRLSVHFTEKYMRMGHLCAQVFLPEALFNTGGSQNDQSGEYRHCCSYLTACTHKGGLSPSIAVTLCQPHPTRTLSSRIYI